MSGHLPECGVRKPCGVCGNITYAVCICDRLRACEQRVRQDCDDLGLIGYGSERGYDDGYAAALDAAKSRARMQMERNGVGEPEISLAVAAIDALRKEMSE